VGTSILVSTTDNNWLTIHDPTVRGTSSHR